MATITGVSTSGYQKIVSLQDCTTRLVRILIDPQYDSQPVNYGFFYILLSEDSGYSKYVYASGIIYKPGIIVPISPEALIYGHNVIVWVNWNTSGYNYAVYI